MKNRHRIAAVAATAAVLALPGPASSLDGPVYASSPAYCAAIAKNPASVTIIGDSLTLNSFGEITGLFEMSGRPVCINAQGGRRSDQASSVISNLRSTGQLGTTVILALGTNDVYRTSAELNLSTKSLLGYSYPRPTVLAVGWRSTEPYGSARVQRIAGEWDAAIERVSSDRWGDELKDAPQLLGPDGIHASQPVGEQAYAAFLFGSLATLPAAQSAARVSSAC